MSINKDRLVSLLDTVVLPFERYIIEDEKLDSYFKYPKQYEIHNLAIAKLTIYIYSDIKRAYEYIEVGVVAHKKYNIPIEFLKESYTLYFKLCRDWSKKHKDTLSNFEKNLKEIEDFVYQSFASQNETKEHFFKQDEKELIQKIESMHYKDEAKITAVEFIQEESIDGNDIADIFEACESLSAFLEDGYNSYDVEFFTSLATSFGSYATVLEKIEEFKDIGYSLSKLSDFLSKNIAEISQSTQKSNLIIVINGI